jgi:hypothetical protein
LLDARIISELLNHFALTAIYSNLNFNALMVTGVICLLFCFSSLFTLFALFQVS